mmetsp:Transcript_15177/g.35756  ORF Transcript_15177/g.35756 Transcript_15177/m.35756 type:complete len:96 (-) Transcript_15177:613-900(-)
MATPLQDRARVHLNHPRPCLFGSEPQTILTSPPPHSLNPDLLNVIATISMMLLLTLRTDLFTAHMGVEIASGHTARFNTSNNSSFQSELRSYPRH